MLYNVFGSSCVNYLYHHVGSIECDNIDEHIEQMFKDIQKEQILITEVEKIDCSEYIDVIDSFDMDFITDDKIAWMYAIRFQQNKEDFLELVYGCLIEPKIYK